MAVMDEFKEERENLKTKPLKEKIGYIFDYYKWPIIIIAVAIIFISSFIYQKVTATDEILNGIFMNTVMYESTFSEEDFTSLSDNFMDSINADASECHISINTSFSYYIGEDNTSEYYTSQNYMALFTWISAETLDFITGDMNTMTALAERELFLDLSDVLSEADYEKYEPYFIYVNDIPVLIDMSESETLLDVYNPPAGDKIVFGITVNSPNLENTVKFVDYLMK